MNEPTSRRTPAVVILSALLVAVLGTPVQAVSAGELDTTFSFDGRETTAVGTSIDQANAVVVHPDGKILAAGGTLSEVCGPSSCDTHWLLVRYQASGLLDSTFGSGGIVTTNMGSGAIYDIALQSDGKIVAVGDGFQGAENDFVIARYLSNGTLDSTFGTGGITRTDFGLHDAASGVAIAGDGTIVAAGSNGLGGPAFNSTFAVARYLSNGTLDGAFSADGKVTTAIGSETSFANDVALQSDGKPVATGGSRDADGDMVFTTVRYTSAGAPDASFAGDGVALKGFGDGPDTAASVLVDAAGKVVVAGSAVVGTEFDFAVLRYTSTGTPDTSFDADGVRTVDINDADVARDLTRQSDGALVVVGSTGAGDGTDFALVRLTSGGALDTAFGGDGKVTTDFFESSDSAGAVALQPDGKIVAAGAVFDPFITDTDVGVARYHGAGSGDAVPPVSQISRPRHNTSYFQANLRSLTGTATDVGSGVIAMDIVLRRHFTDGTCANWNGSQFVTGSCKARLWHRALGRGSWTYTLPRVLTKSTGTNVKHYILLSRATDAEGNVETAFNDGRNRSQFEVI